MQWLTENYQTLIAVLFGVLSVASAITKLTPSPKDDAVVAKILAWLSFLQPKGAGSVKLPLTRPAQPEAPFRNLVDDDAQQ